MTPLILTPADVLAVEQMANRRIVAARAERRVPLHRPEFPARSPAKTLAEAETANYRWLNHHCEVLERFLKDAGQENAKLRDRALDAEESRDLWRLGFWIAFAVLAVVLASGWGLA